MQCKVILVSSTHLFINLSLNYKKKKKKKKKKRNGQKEFKKRRRPEFVTASCSVMAAQCTQHGMTIYKRTHQQAHCLNATYTDPSAQQLTFCVSSTDLNWEMRASEIWAPPSIDSSLRTAEMLCTRTVLERRVSVKMRAW